MTNIAITLSVAEEAIALSADDNRACSDERSRKDKHSSGEESRARTGNESSSKTRPLCNGGRLREKFLCLQRIWTHGLSL